MANKPLRFLVIGAGGIGSSLARYLTMMLEFKVPGSGLLIVDGDVFESKNRERQVFGAFGNKAEIVAAEIVPTITKTAVIPLAKWIVEEVPKTDEEGDAGKITAEELLREGDVVFPVVDNFKARKLIFDAASNLDNIDVISAGNDDQLYCSLYHYQRRDGVDITMHPRHRHPEYDNPPDRNPGELSCQERAKIDGGTQLLAANIAAVALILGKVQTAIFDRVDYAEGVERPDEIFFDLGLGMASPFDRSAEPILSKQGAS